MSTRKKIYQIDPKKHNVDKMKKVLDLEKKYFDILYSLFTSASFIKDLKLIEKEIQKNYNFLTKVWDEKNKIKIPAERLTRFYIYRYLSDIILNVYPSPVSSDIAFITKDAVINIDVKTLDYKGNKGDINNLQFESNQSSFHNINLDTDPNIKNSGIKVETLLPEEFSFNNGQLLPVLTYFLVIVYKDDSKKFQLYRGDSFNTIYLKCLPNGILSPLFDYDLISNFKTYSYFDIKQGFKPIYLTDDSEKVLDSIENYINKFPDFQLINGRSKKGAFNSKQVHPIYKTSGVSWFPVSRKVNKIPSKKEYYLEAVNKGHTNRISNLSLIERYDSHNKRWDGVKSISLKDK